MGQKKCGGAQTRRSAPRRLGKLGRDLGELPFAEVFEGHENGPSRRRKRRRKALLFPRALTARTNGQKARRSDAVLCKIFGKSALRRKPRKGNLFLAAHLQNKIARPDTAADDAAEVSILPSIL